MFNDPPPDDPYAEWRIVEPIVSDPYWFGNEIVLEDGYGELHSYTKEEWHEVLLLDKETLNYYYGMDNIDIILDFVRQGFWDEEDWERWRDAYATVHGV